MNDQEACQEACQTCQNVYPQQQSEQALISISDIERLAKAGVHISLTHVFPQPDNFPTPPPEHTNGVGMEDAIWDRWKRTKKAQRAGNGRYDDFEMYHRPFQLLATQHGDKVWVSVHPINFAYEPFMLEDDAIVFPSDALMAKIALWQKDHQ